MRIDLDYQNKITRFFTGWQLSLLSHAPHLGRITITNPWRYFEFEIQILMSDLLVIAGLTSFRRFTNLIALATWLSEHLGKGAHVHMLLNFTLSTTRLADFHAVETRAGNSDPDVFGDASVRILECYVDDVFVICTSDWPPLTTAKHLSKNIGRKSTWETTWRRPFCAAKLIKVSPLFWIGQHVISFLDPLELFWITTLVRMMLHNKFPVCLFDLVLGCVFIQT